jgi:replicative DNA helicase
MATNAEKLLPQNVEAEAGLLGSVLIDPDMLGPCMAIVEHGDFYREAHRRIWHCAVDLFNAREPVDLITLTDELTRRGWLEEVGGISYVSSLANQVPTSAHAEAYAHLVFRAYFLRKLIHIAGQIAAVAYNDPEASVAYDQTLRLVSELGRRLYKNEDVTYGEAIDLMREDILLRMSGDPTAALFQFGVEEIDHALGGGLEAGDLMYIAARPSVGKTSIALLLAHSSAIIHRKRDQEARKLGKGAPECSVYVGLEQSPTALARRMVSGRAEVDSRLLRSGFRQRDGEIDRDQYLRADDAALREREELGGFLRLKRGPMSFMTLRGYLMSRVAEYGARLAFIDQLDLLRDDSHEYTGEPKSRDEYTRVTNLSRALKQLAVELGIPLVVLVQLNRESVKRPDPTPTLESVKGSGQIEQDADVLMTAHKPSDNDDTETDDEAYKCLVVAQFLKVRESRRFVRVPLCFDERYGGRVSSWPVGWPALDDVLAMAEERKANAQEDKQGKGGRQW